MDRPGVASSEGQRCTCLPEPTVCVFSWTATLHYEAGPRAVYFEVDEEVSDPDSEGLVCVSLVRSPLPR